MTMCKSLNILLVDDHRVLRTGMKLLLKTQEGFNVAAEASDGKEALQIFLFYRVKKRKMPLT